MISVSVSEQLGYSIIYSSSPSSESPRDDPDRRLLNGGVKGMVDIMQLNGSSD